jgi:hypothetical protein
MQFRVGLLINKDNEFQKTIWACVDHLQQKMAMKVANQKIWYKNESINKLEQDQSRVRSLMKQLSQIVRNTLE